MKNKLLDKDKYIIENIPWKDKVKLEKIPRFDIKYNDIIIFHFDYLNSLLKVRNNDYISDIAIDPSFCVNAINICLTYYSFLKKLYPYNKVYVIIHVNGQSVKNCRKAFEILNSIVSIIPNFAVITKNDYDDLDYYDNSKVKHIYCDFGVQKFKPLKIAESQAWHRVNGGKLYIITQHKGENK